MCIAFDASPTSFGPGGGTTTLTWETENATSVSIDNGIGNVSENGSVSVPVTSTTTFTLTVDGDAGGEDCDVTVTVQPPVNPPAACIALTASPTSFVGSGTTTLTWDTENGTSVSINNGIGLVAADGSISVPVTTTTTFILAVTGADGSADDCSATVTVTTPNAPACIAFTASPTSFAAPGGVTTLTWDTENATSVSISGIGAVAADGSQTVNITGNTTFTLTASGAGTPDDCTVNVVVIPANQAACIAFTGTPTSIDPGETVTLTWDTENATSVSIDQGIGNVPADGIMTVSPNSDITYTLTVSNATSSADCVVSIDVDTGTNNPEPWCELTISDSSIEEGDEVTLEWRTRNVDTFEINQGIGEVHPTSGGEEEVSPNDDTEYRGTGRGPYGTVICDVDVEIDNGGGGGGGGSRKKKPDVTLLKEAPEEPLAYVYLNQIPYTGLDLGPVGTVVYWTALVLWSLALAYLLMFKMLPYFGRRSREFGHNVHSALNNDHGHAAALAHVATHTQAPNHLVTAHYNQNVEPVQFAHTEAIAEAPRGFSTYDGFRSFGSAGAVTIDDIVKGLSREPMHHAAPAPVHEAAHAPIAHAPAAPAHVEKQLSHDTRGFIIALMQGDRENVFAAIRVLAKSGDVQTFLTDVICGLDDAYRARIDGSPVDPEVARAVANVATPVLERVIASLTTAVDSSYSLDVTGAKLAVTRALGVLGA